MSLSQYQKKRKFNLTSEPEGKKKSSGKGLRFVIQKHDASHLHYDFRLEMEGVLKSWAIPKGPSLNPDDKRLAMMVEDHPYDYRTFEGIIPEGEYGGGTVIVWDEGFYKLLGGEELTVKEQEQTLLGMLKKGDLKLHMYGKKIKGAYALFQMKGKGDRTWLLVKKADEEASKKDITKEDTSVKSGKNLEQVATAHGTTVHHPEHKTASEKEPPIQLLTDPKSKRKSAKASSADDLKSDMKSTTIKKNTAPKKATAKKQAAKKTATKTASKKMAGKTATPKKKIRGRS